MLLLGGSADEIVVFSGVSHDPCLIFLYLRVYQYVLPVYKCLEYVPSDSFWIHHNEELVYWRGYLKPQVTPVGLFNNMFFYGVVWGRGFPVGIL